MNQRVRKPTAFRLDDHGVMVTPASAGAIATPDEPDNLAPVAETAALRRRRAPWGLLFWFSAAGLLVLATGLGIANLIEDLLARATWLGGLGIALAAVAGVALAAIAGREALALARLGTIDHLRERATATLANDDRAAGRALGRDLVALTRRMPRLARARTRLEGHLDDIIDGGDLVRLAERELMAPLDEEARRLVSAAAKRVSIVTAVSPRAAVDMFFVLVTALGLVRRLALLYGGRPGTLGLLRLMRHAVSHLALTGSMAASDSLIQQVVGHGVAAKVSTRLGEGMLNGMLTARLGLAAIDVTRPLPFTALRRPALNDLAGALLRGPENRGTEDALAVKNMEHRK